MAKQRRGFYPGLLLLGIHDHCTPCLASEISMMATVLSSFQEARQILQDRGFEVGVKAIRMITQRYAQRAKASQRAQESSFVETVAGCRVVVSMDGGRIRIRKDKRGPKTQKGRNHYSTRWREPKLLIIYAVNEKGEMDKKFTPFIDGTLEGPDAVFGLMKYYLGKLHIKNADKILFVADGARWIWNRVKKLISSLGISSDRVYELVDFYHAVEHLGSIATLRKGWKPSQRKRWIKKNRRLLLKGKVDEVVSEIKQICRGRSTKKLKTEMNYFVRNCKRMAYDTVASLELPIGSGAMESAIRRVVNLRLKGASIYWRRETAEAMLLLRSFYKAGRWNMLNKLASAAQLANAA